MKENAWPSSLSDYLRSLLRNEPSLRAVALAVAIPQPTLNDFVHGRSDGSYSDLRLTAAEKLMEYYGLKVARSNKSVAKSPEGKMLLTRVLRTKGVQMDAKEFKHHLIAGLMEWFPERTIDSLVCEPKDAKEYCRLVRENVGSHGLNDYEILKTLMNIRRDRNCPKGLNSRRTRILITNVLSKIGGDLPAERFKEILVDTVPGVCRNRTVDDLCCYADQAHDYCNRVRHAIGCPNLTDTEVLRSLMNYRKAPVKRARSRSKS